MGWPWRSRQAVEAEWFGPPLDELDPASLESLELDPVGSRIGEPRARWDVPAEVSYSRPGGDPTGLAGIWEALQRA